MGEPILPAVAVQPPEPAAEVISDPQSVERRQPTRLPSAPALWFLATLGAIGLLYFARAFFIPLLVSLLASYTLAPVVNVLQRLRLPRVVAAALVIVVIAVGVGWGVASLRDDVQDVVARLPETAHQLRQSISAARASGPTPLQQLQQAATELQRAAAEASGSRQQAPAAPADLLPFAMMRDYLVATSSTLVIGALVGLPLVLLLTYFLLASGDHFRRKLMTIADSTLTRKKITLDILNEIDTQVQRYMLVTLASNILVGLGTWLAFWMLGLQKPGLWGTAAGVLHFVPYLGPGVIAVAGTVAAFMQFGTPAQALAVGGASVVVSVIVGMLFMPWLQSRVSSINAAVLFIALLFFGWMWGAWGLLLGAPVVAIVKVISDRIEPLNRLGHLLGR